MICLSDLLVATATLIRICTTIAHRLLTSAGLMTMMVVRMDTPLAHLSRHLAQSTWHLENSVPGADTWHLAHHQNLASGVCLKRAFKMQFRKGRAPQSKVMAKT